MKNLNFFRKQTIKIDKFERSENMKKVIARVIAIVFAVVILIGVISGFLINLEWFKEVNYVNVFLTSLKAKVIIFVPMFILMYFLIFFYVRNLISKYSETNPNIVYDKKEIKKKSGWIRVIAAVFSFFISMGFTSSFWYKILQFMNGVDFGIKDPIFHKDAGFYMFKMPLLSGIVGFLTTAVILLFIITLAFYFIVKSRDRITSMRQVLRGYDSPETKFIARQFAILGAVFLILLSAIFYMNTLNLVYSERGVAVGASYTDVHVTIPFYRIISVVSIISAFVVAVSILRRKVKPILYTAGFMVALIFIEGASSFIVEKMIVSPNAREKEKPYLSYNIDFTRKGFNLENIDEREFPVDYNLSQKDIENNKDTVDNIRINEFSQALDVYNQVQAIKNYYKFNDVDIDRYTIDGQLRQVFIAARELDNSNRDQKFQTWQNKHLYYTHGYGAVMSYTNVVSQSGLPEFIEKDMPVSGKIDIKKPQIYFGELSNDYAIVGPNNEEIDYPSGNDLKKTKYDGTAGIKLTPFNKLLFATNYGTMNFLLSGDINGNSKVLINRNIMDRVKKIAPFLNYDKDPYLVAGDDGKLYWIIDAYTTSDRFPFSEEYDGINYIRNSIKVVIDAYNGNTDFYIVDKSDAVAQTIGKIYKGLFKDVSQMPKDLKKHLRYSEDVFLIKAKVYEKYHMTDPSLFYNNDDLWTVASYKNQDGTDASVKPVYQVMKLPGDSKEEFMLTISYTVAKKQNMSGWLAVKMDEEGNSKMTLIKFPKEASIYGPQQFNSKMNTDTNIASLLTLLSQRGSQTVFGETTIIPIKNSLIFVRPLYLKSQGQTLPELKKVIVGYGDNLVMEDDIKTAIAKLFNINMETQGQQPQTQTQPGTAVNGDAASLVNKASDLFNKAKDSQTKGDWAGYGEYLKQLEDVLNQLKGKVK